MVFFVAGNVAGGSSTVVIVAHREFVKDRTGAHAIRPENIRANTTALGSC